ncbi:capsular exopolysaccharide family [Paenibacillus algorifonticola]|uniref:non-specific protein-tyrosine kinase n=1 Tax=Paenibacillus algorifonticola TaxID=684063 RepID=A0A1I2GII3_9BACL|nr:CpsD/CapB family tyrosine-protein kinase [Paenibacillus algorifonticola]SFF16780.1 capsular exopolysaccharide family [Paenibacillus algorifonticola]
MRRLTSETNLVALTNPNSPISEVYRTLRTNIQYAEIDTPKQILMIASSQPDEGKTTTITNLAVTIAQEERKVLLVDADMRKPSLHQVFDKPNRIGLSSVISNQFSWQEAVMDTMVEHLSVITSGPIPPNPSEMLGSNKMKALVQEWKNHYDVILFDTPPVLAVTDALIVSAFCDGVVLVVLAGKVKKEMVKKMKANLDRVQAQIVGVVMNKINPKDSEDIQLQYYETVRS